ncbi:ABC transporter ATP-binding protein [Chelatococcus asaccharovorans]|uniref:Branched-chain amino acid transport system ATP-binding protein/neutral amino acid transport system ATP-binding protein n=1 Tax=Chelatococcus asaccharovorans TaxID=28210 RepID=A0A2V3TZ76_9HYPH|nr:ABC transporter ATP-binding protein [Chelatococcus asaccharovorans]MBS7707628.1 ABC transporter ATP-binding protein [Chelatococcus asaccharovorans]PXW55202.1 branched-chain amino acid transport system ATP-binding protein/neutral amino acid transport system ATP-binding protein [Chelatococcus asaccharovorans]
MAPILEVSAIAKRFGGVVALDGAGFSVDKPGIVALIGPNGAGKTTLFDIICGRQNADSGEVRFMGERVDGLPPFRLSRLGFARSFQECRVLPEATCLENMLFSAQDKTLRSEMAGIFRGRAHNRNTVDKARELLAMVGLERFSNRPASDLSFGQKRLVEIASTLMGAPKVLLLDEPASGVNPTLLNILHDFLLDQAPKMGLLLVVIEHNMEFIMSVAERIVVLHQGRVLEDGPPAAIQASPQVIEAYLS